MFYQTLGDMIETDLTGLITLAVRFWMMVSDRTFAWRYGSYGSPVVESGTLNEWPKWFQVETVNV